MHLSRKKKMIKQKVLLKMEKYIPKTLMMISLNYKL